LSLGGSSFANYLLVGIGKPAATVRAIVIAVSAMVCTGAIVSGDTVGGQLMSSAGAATQVSLTNDSQLDSSPIPEPAALSLLGLGLLVVGRTVRARRA
jgi:hypothetical protein